MTATMYLNMPNFPTDPPGPAATADCNGPMDATDGECNTPEIISMMLSNNYWPSNQSSGFPSSQPPNGYCGLDPTDIDMGPMSGFTVTSSSPETGIPPSYCSPQVASSPPACMSTCAMTPSASTNMISPSSVCSVEETKRQLIKEGLRMTIQHRQMTNGQACSPIDCQQARHSKDEDDVGSPGQVNYYLHSVSSPEEYYYSGSCVLTPEDEERRKRRRERNKIAATKCRNKKKEKTNILVWEAENLVSTNVSLKDEIEKLNGEIQRLQSLLKNHQQVCAFSFHHAAPYYDTKNNDCSTTL